MFLRLTFLLLAMGCGQALEHPDCGELAMRTADGSIDDCDLQACEAAFGGGCEDCVVLKSLPPIYSGDGVDFDVYDFCPDWAPG